MKAARWYGNKDIRIEDVPKPSVTKDDDVLIEIEWCGICGTDLHEYAEGPVYIQEESHILTGQKPPITLGHEFSGIVRAVGSAVTRVKLGDSVCCYPVLSCRKCDFCLQGKYHFCKKIGYIGTSLDGGFAEYTVVPEYSCTIVPAGISAEEASIIEPAAMVVRAASRVEVKHGDCVAIIGCGPIGLIAIQIARLYGASKIIAFDTVAERRNKAESLGADITINPGQINFMDELHISLDGVNISIIFECVGSNQAMELCTSLASPGSKIMVMGINPGLFPLRILDLVDKEIELMGNMGGGGFFEKTLQHVADGHLDLKTLISAKIGLKNFIPQLDAIFANRSKFLKVLVDPKDV
ncbi:alcohol dehydrogenase catalytic domain-containing protein [uncultured Sphaerochaeta sp.]|uniref:alcohol dehydrogenase catalytic domain-containing protein n=1 Tax=uncultured Sphaerochaeta sp. TaxID=886478 RepID=UPI002A0A2EE3|nr:alcohol dehydrogenase catalytic domain-containing protein [uncultured Sphaerochaeta sp.]